MLSVSAGGRTWWGAVAERPRPLWLSSVVFACLALFTLSQGDGNPVPEWIISSCLLLLSAGLLFSRIAHLLPFGWPSILLFGMAGYGVIQALVPSRVVLYNSLSATLFWLTGALICLLAGFAFGSRTASRTFRIWFAWFAGAVCVLDLLQQASGTDRFFWLIPSRYHSVSGPFAYWNNLAQFVELALPVTLWLGLGRRRLDYSYIVLAALQIGAVAAAGSRAGAVVVMGELILVFLLLFLRNRTRAFIWAAAGTLAVTVVVIFAAGTTHVMAKFHQQDQLAVRRDINRSSFAMIQQRPLLGWGLGSYVSVYRKFALYDDGTFVNRAHNDWFQWAVEGGIPFAAFMAGILVWSIRPALRSIWGIGVLAVCLHAAVDYPFARLGVCGWYFALIGLLQMEERQDRAASGFSRGRGHSRLRPPQPLVLPSDMM